MINNKQSTITYKTSSLTILEVNEFFLTNLLIYYFNNLSYDLFLEYSRHRDRSPKLNIYNSISSTKIVYQLTILYNNS